MMTAAIPSEGFLEAGHTYTRVRVVRLLSSGRSLLIELPDSRTQVVSVYWVSPVDACTFSDEGTRVTILPHKWEGTPGGTHSPDTLHLNVIPPTPVGGAHVD